MKLSRNFSLLNSNKVLKCTCCSVFCWHSSSDSSWVFEARSDCELPSNVCLGKQLFHRREVKTYYFSPIGIETKVYQYSMILSSVKPCGTDFNIKKGLSIKRVIFIFPILLLWNKIVKFTKQTKLKQYLSKNTFFQIVICHSIWCLNQHFTFLRSSPRDKGKPSVRVVCCPLNYRPSSK